MKKISKELLKNYYAIISITLIIYSILNYSIVKYYYSYARQEIYNVESFLEKEFKEPEHANLDYFLNVILDESPKISDVFVSISYDGKHYKYPNTPELGILQFNPKIQRIGLKYWVLNREFIINNTNKKINIQIIKDLDSIIDFFKRIFIISFIGLITLITTSAYIMRRFYNNFIPQVLKLEETANQINLNSFDLNIDKTDYFNEFSNVLTAYEKMISRINSQTSSQIDFVNNASHELKTPIFILKSYTNLIKKYGQNNKQILEESINSISEEVSNMEKLVEKLLFLSRNDVDNITKETFNISDLICEIIHEMNILHPTQVIIYKENKIFILSNWTLCKQVIRNVIDNAIKYGNNNPIEVTLENDINKVIIKIKDHGVGISASDLKNVFNKFYRVDKSHSRNLGGHGLGLSIVKSILNNINGDIEIFSLPNFGTTVKIVLSNNNQNL